MSDFKQNFSWKILISCILICVISYFYNGGTYIPTEIGAKCPRDFDNFKFLNFSTINNKNTAFFRYFEPMHELPQYILPFIKIVSFGVFDISKYNYSQFKNIQIEDGILSFNIAPQISGERKYQIYLCDKLVYEGTKMTTFTTYVLNTSVIETLDTHYTIRNACIVNNTLKLFFPYEVDFKNGTHIRNFSLNAQYLGMNYAIKHENYSFIDKETMHINYVGNGVEFMSDLIFGYKDINANNFSIIETESSLKLLEKLNFKRIELFKPPTCFSYIEFLKERSQYQTNSISSLLKNKTTNHSKVVVSKKISSKMKQYEGVDTENAELLELIDKISDAKVFVGVNSKDFVASLLMGDRDVAYIDLSSCFSAGEQSRWRNGPKVLQARKFDLCRNEIDYENLNNMIHDILDNSENSPLFFD